MRWGIAAVVVACFGVALADEMDNANLGIRTLTADSARHWNAGRDSRTGFPISKHQAAGYGEILVVHAEAVEPLALSALSTKQHVVYRNLKTLGPEHLAHLDKDAYRPSLPSIESMTPELAKRLSGCKDLYDYKKAPFHLCGLKSIDRESLRHLKDLPLCLCGLEEISGDTAEGIVRWRNEYSAGVLLSNKTKMTNDAWRIIEPRVRDTHPTSDDATLFNIDTFFRVIEGRCRHRDVTFATPDERKANQPPPPKPQPRPNPFNR